MLLLVNSLMRGVLRLALYERWAPSSQHCPDGEIDQRVTGLVRWFQDPR